ncbi:hypothetical protein P9250_19745 [Caballeronia sp. LP006]|uniref:hypothetical protein n=1 Tax=Caballeronia sp. LP006 TaxID=3038552 RepID=UPI0028566346|nr:hypothetical protein [Caballeronia sp. LP006]MDR5830110.1 hypothetical protein [Caballeronia sp. LP006]
MNYSTSAQTDAEAAPHASSSVDIATTVIFRKTVPVNRAVDATTVYTTANVRPERGTSSPLRSVAPEPEQVYPHLFDPKETAGQALDLVGGALDDARDALIAFGESDLQAVGSRLAQIAVAMQKAHKLTTFNEDFGAVVSFIRRASLMADPVEVTRPMLNAQVQVLVALKKSPAIDLDDASEMVDRLEDAGWRGEHPAVEAILAALSLDKDDKVLELPADTAKAEE